MTERTGYIGRIRNLARACAEAFLAQREAMGFPLLGGRGERPEPTPRPDEVRA